MELNELQFNIPVFLEKSTRKKNEENYPIRIGISSSGIDRQKERMSLKSVFDQKAIDYHMAEGYVDYDHMSFRGATPLEKAQSICGKPYDFEWVMKGGEEIPVVECNLFRGNPYVEKAIIPAMEHGNGVFGASIGGRTLQKSKPEFDKKAGAKVSTITKIKWIHDAITPLYKAVNTDTFIENVAKSLATITENAIHREDLRAMQVIDSFSALEKALTANEGITDYVTTQGGASMQAQSLEGARANIGKDIVKLNTDLMNSMVVLVKTGQIVENLDTFIQWFENRGMEHSLAIQYGSAMYNSMPQIKNLKI